MSSPNRVAVHLWVLCLGLVGLAATAAAQPRDLQVTPDGYRVVLNKDVGEERWAMTYDRLTDTLSGSVYFESGQSPAFFHCASLTPADPETVTLSCWISNPGCGASPPSTELCPQAGEWQHIPTTQELPRSFFGLEPLAPPEDPSCALPEAAADQRIVLFGSYEGDAISTVTIAGQDEETATARVVIEPGADPLYVLLTSYSATIWRFEGALDRVARIVLTGWNQQAVTGIPANRVTDLSGVQGPDSSPICFRYFYDPRSVDGVAARGVVERILGRPVDVFAGEYDVGTVSLPSAAVSSSVTPPVPEGFDADEYREATWFSPGGLVSIDPAAVVPSGTAEPYEVFPAQFGLAQLVGSGALEVNSDGSYYIAQPIPRFPPGLHGAHSVDFILGRGVPLPAGSPGHSCVISEETGLVLADSFCHSLS